MKIKIETFGSTKKGEKVDKITLTNDSGFIASLIQYGATLQSLRMPDRHGTIGEITFGFDTLGEYEGQHPFYGSTIGRFANRIARGKFILNGVRYKLPLNDGKNHLHGGPEGFHRKVWQYVPIEDKGSAGIRFTLRSPDGDSGYPGNFDATVTYKLTSENELVIDYEAVTDKPTIVNLTNHAYWNLDGEGCGTILGHHLQLDCPEYLPVDDACIPLGNIMAVDGTPYDFRKTKEIGKDISKTGTGYDHCFVISGEKGKCRQAADVFSQSSGRRMIISTTQQGIQLYSGNFMENGRSRTGRTLLHAGLCLETEGYPDSINHPAFPQPVLSPGEKYSERTVHLFGVQK